MSRPAPRQRSPHQSELPHDLQRRLDHLEEAASPLEPPAAERRRLLEAVVASAEAYWESLEPPDERPVYVEDEGLSARLLDHPIGDAGMAVEDALALFEAAVVEPGSHPASGGHLAYIPGGPLYHAALGDLLAALGNKFPTFAFTGPGPSRMEGQLLRWTADLVGYPAGAGGHMASGGSLANLSAVVAARDAHGVTGTKAPEMVAYTTAQAHHCIAKALHIAGLGETVRRQIPVDEGQRMVPAALAEQLAADRVAGLTPWLLVANAGSTDAGAVDPLEPLADLAAEYGCWFHVDAAYGGFFLLTDHGRRKLSGIERSDSVVLDPHKSLFLPWGSGIVLVRRVEDLLRPFSHSASYLQDAPGAGAPDDMETLAGDPDAPPLSPPLSPMEVSPELSRPFRALRLWLPLITLGLAPFRAALEEKLLLARDFRRRVAELGYTVGPEPDLSITTFRWAPPGLPPEAADDANRQLVENLRRDGRAFFSSTTLGGRVTLRMCALALRTHRPSLDRALAALEELRPG